MPGPSWKSWYPSVVTWAHYAKADKHIYDRLRILCTWTLIQKTALSQHQHTLYEWNPSVTQCPGHDLWAETALGFRPSDTQYPGPDLWVEFVSGLRTNMHMYIYSWCHLVAISPFTNIKEIVGIRLGKQNIFFRECYIAPHAFTHLSMISGSSRPHGKSYWQLDIYLLCLISCIDVACSGPSLAQHDEQNLTVQSQGAMLI